jgi:hypothetical protein
MEHPVKLIPAKAAAAAVALIATALIIGPGHAATAAHHGSDPAAVDRKPTPKPFPRPTFRPIVKPTNSPH